MALVVAAVFIAYRNVWHAGFIWDDSGHVTRLDLRPLSGLWRIWFQPGATQQYYPVLHSFFWIEHRLWGDASTGYHLINLVLHSAVALLLYRLLRRLRIPGAHLAAAAFALHPVCVESVAWISEEKNTLSAVFYLGAALAYLRFDESRGPVRYGVATLLFALALLSKSVTATLPAALLVVFWWKRGRLSWRADVLPLVPWFCIAGGSGAMTSWMERTYVGARGAVYALSFFGRLLVAGRAVWFYAGKLIWPSNLIFIYPHWGIDDRVAWQYLYPIAASAVLVALYLYRKKARGPLASGLLFVGTLFPALGFINVYPFIYSYVADHFQYLAAAFAISAVSAGVTLGAERLSGACQTMARVLAVCVVAVLAWLTSRQCSMYADVKTLWLTTIAKNPGCWMAYGNLGDTYLKEDRVDDATAEYEKAAAINPDYPESHNDLGVAFIHQGKLDAAIAEFQRVLELSKDNAEAHNNLGNIFSSQHRNNEAIVQYQEALEIDPSDIGAHYNLGNMLMRVGRVRDAVSEYHETLERVPDDIDAHYNLGGALLQLGQLDAATSEYRATLKLDPNSYKSHMNLGAIFLKGDHFADAISEFQEVLRINADYTDARFDLGNAFIQAGRLDDAIAQFEKILEVNPGDSEARRNLSVALFKKGRIDEANAQYQQALHPK